MFENKGFSYIDVVIVISVLGLLAVAAIPRSFDKQVESISESYGEGAIKYIGSLHNSLAAHVEDHDMLGTKWVKDGKEIMTFLDKDREMPESMHYANNVWIDNESGLQWEFVPSSNKAPPRIRRLPPKPQPKISD